MSDFVHMELNTSDREGAKKFYKDVFGWKFQDMPMPDGTYTMVTGADGGIGGIQDNPMPGTPSNWLGYVGVKSLAQTIAKVKKSGGQVLAQHDIPEMGTLAIFLDPQGASVAAWQAAAPAEPAKKKAAKKKAAKKKAGKKKAGKKKAAKETVSEETVSEAGKKKAGKKKAAKKKAGKKKAAKKKAAKKKAGKKKAGKKKAGKKKAARKKAATKKAGKKKAAKKKSAENR